MLSENLAGACPPPSPLCYTFLNLTECHFQTKVQEIKAAVKAQPPLCAYCSVIPPVKRHHPPEECATGKALKFGKRHELRCPIRASKED